MPRDPSAWLFVSPIWGKLQNQRARKLKNVVKWADETKKQKQTQKTNTKKKKQQQSNNNKESERQNIDEAWPLPPVDSLLIKTSSWAGGGQLVIQSSSHPLNRSAVHWGAQSTSQTHTHRPYCSLPAPVGTRNPLRTEGEGETGERALQLADGKRT